MMVRLQRQYIIAVVFLVDLMPVTAQSYECDTEIGSALEASNRFDIETNGSLTDLQSGLTWMRCALGQTWNGSTCKGDALTYSWNEVGQEIKKLNATGGFASFADWRLPKLPELASIIDARCQFPRTSLKLFPNTPATTFWSANKKPGWENSVYILDFGAKGLGISETGVSNSVRLVRGMDNLISE